MAKDLIHWTVLEHAARIRAGEACAEEVVQAFLDRIQLLDHRLNSFITLDAEGALAAARKVDQRLSRGERLGPLAGVPLALKDIFVTKGLETTCGSRILKGWIPPYDSTHVCRLREAGAIILGKLNMDEFAMGSSNETSAAGPCLNPWDRTRVPGGSSGGSAAAVAASLCAAALGSDTGGSVRQPAAFCGVVGVKPTYGRVSRYGMVAYGSSLDQAGPITRTVRDSALLLEILAGADPLDSTCLPQPPGAYLAACDHDLEKLRLGLPREVFAEGVDPEVEARVRGAIETFRGLGAQIVEVSLPHSKYAIATYTLLCTAEASSNLSRFEGVRYGARAPAPANLEQLYVKTRQRGFGPEVKRRIMLGTFALSAGYYDAYYAKAQRARTLIRRDYAEALTRCDLLVMPTAPTAAFKLGEKLDDPLQMALADIFTVGCSLAGLPGMSLPCGFTAEGLPVGLQLIGPALGEETLFAAAAAYEAAAPWHERRPTLGDTEHPQEATP